LDTRHVRTLTITGTWPNGCMARNSGVLC
jgi:hypothetical protein